MLWSFFSGSRLSPRNSSTNLGSPSNRMGAPREGTFTRERISSGSPGLRSQNGQKFSKTQPVRQASGKMTSPKSFGKKASSSTRPPARLSPLSNQGSPQTSPKRQPLGSYNKVDSGQYGQYGTTAAGNYPDGPSEDSGQSVNLVPCSNCGRNFAADRISKHMSICVKSSSKQRKVFDSTKARIQGTEMASIARIKKPEPPKPKNNWRAKHGEKEMRLLSYPPIHPSLPSLWPSSPLFNSFLFFLPPFLFFYS